MKLTKLIILIITIVVTAIMVANFAASNDPTLKNAATAMTTWGAILTNFAFLTAAFSYIRRQTVQIRNAATKKTQIRELPYLLIAFIIAIVFSVVGLVLGASSSVFANYFNYVMTSGGAANAATLGFLYYAVLFRVMRVRSWDATIFLLCFVVTVWVSMPMSGVIPQLQSAGNWATIWISTPGTRAVTLSVAVGQTAIVLRSLIGYEKTATTTE
jgi:hypothetical protein